MRRRRRPLLCSPLGSGRASWISFNCTIARSISLARALQGQYVPYIADAMLKQEDEARFHVSGIMIYDPSFGWPQVSKQVPAASFTDLHHSRCSPSVSCQARIRIVLTFFP